jgi:hypothetical protein
MNPNQPEDRSLTWLDVVRPDKDDPTVIESQESEKENVLGYLSHCQETGLKPDSLNNWQTYQSQQ